MAFTRIKKGAIVYSIISSLLTLDGAGDAELQDSFVAFSKNLATNTENAHIDRFSNLMQKIDASPECAEALEEFLAPFFEKSAP